MYTYVDIDISQECIHKKEHKVFFYALRHRIEHGHPLFPLPIQPSTLPYPQWGTDASFQIIPVLFSIRLNLIRLCYIPDIPDSKST